MATPALTHTARLEPGTSADLDSVVEVMDAAFGRRFGEAWSRSQLAGILPLAGVSLTLAREDGNGTPIGFSLVRTVADESELLLLAVRPVHQHQGIGRRLLEDFMERASASGIRRVHLEVRDGNAAVAMYRAAGFEQAGKRRNYYHAPDGSRFDALTLVCEL
jgi:[ribosomal protein S18]-alanine N-acetyltransferase